MISLVLFFAIERSLAFLLGDCIEQPQDERKKKKKKKKRWKRALMEKKVEMKAIKGGE